MHKVSGLIVLFFWLILFSCKPGEDPVLKEAMVIQDEAIHLGMEVDKMIGEVMVSDTARENLLFTGSLKSKLLQWKKEMIIIPGMKHDHDHDDHSHGGEGDHAGHDHGDHQHLQGDVKGFASHLSPFELKEVQVEWKNEILKLKEELENYKKEKGK